MQLLVAYTFVWLLIYAPLETFVTVSIAGIGGLIYSAYIMNVLGMALMLLGALFGKRGRAVAPGVLTAGWSWTAATFWRATSDRFSFTAIGGSLYFGRIELWLAPILAALACVGLAASLRLVVQASRSSGKHGRVPESQRNCEVRAQGRGKAGRRNQAARSQKGHNPAWTPKAVPVNC